MCRITPIWMLCLLRLTSCNAFCECENDDQSLIPSYTFIDRPQAIIDPHNPLLNDTNDNPMANHFGSACVSRAGFYECSNNSDNPLFDCSADNNDYYGWDTSSSRNPVVIVSYFANQFQSMNVLIKFLISTSSNLTVPNFISYAPILNETFVAASVMDKLPTNLTKGPYHHTSTLLSGMMLKGFAIYINPDPTIQWVAIGRIIFCPAVTEGQAIASSLVTVTGTSPIISYTISSTVFATIHPTATIVTSTTTTTNNNTVVPISSSDNIPVSVVIISVTTTAGALVLIGMLLFVIIVSHKMKNKNNIHNRRDAITQSSISGVTNDDHNPQQHMQNTSSAGQPQNYHDDEDGLSEEAENYRSSRMETINELYISTNAKYHDSVLEKDKLEPIAIVVDSDVDITPNPSYAVIPNPPQISDQYDSIQIDDQLLQHNTVGCLQLASATLNKASDKVIDPVSND